MLVREIMERTNMSNFGLARMFIEDALIDMSIKQAPWQREIDISIINGIRFYDIPVDCIKITDIIVKNHMNSKGEYRSIPRLLNEPKNKDVGQTNPTEIRRFKGTSDLNKVSNSLNEAGHNMGEDYLPNIGSQAMEYGYYIKGDKIAIVEKALYQDPNADVTNDINAYQRSNYEWRSPSISNLSGIKIRYAYKPTYYINRLGQGEKGDSSGSNSFAEVVDVLSPLSNAHNIVSTGGYPDDTEWIFVLCEKLDDIHLNLGSAIDLDLTEPSRAKNFALNKWVFMENAGFFTGLWEITKTHGDDHAAEAGQKNAIGLKRPIQWHSGQSPETNGKGLPIDGTLMQINMDEWRRQSLLIANVSTLYTDQEDYNLPISDMQARAMICFIKAQMALETGNIEVKEYFDKEYETKLAQQETAYVTGPRMISAGPFALK